MLWQDCNFIYLLHIICSSIYYTSHVQRKTQQVWHCRNHSIHGAIQFRTRLLWHVHASLCLGQVCKENCRSWAFLKPFVCPTADYLDDAISHSRTPRCLMTWAWWYCHIMIKWKLDSCGIILLVSVHFRDRKHCKSGLLNLQSTQR